MEEEFDNNLYFMMLNETGSGDDPIIEDDYKSDESEE